MPRSKRILIVEDESMTAMAMAEYLETLGHEVLVLPPTAEQAVLIAERERPDVVFMDINLPGKMDGIEAAERISRLGPVAIIFMTGYSNKSILDRAKARFPAACIEKPFDFALLDGILSSLG